MDRTSKPALILASHAVCVFCLYGIFVLLQTWRYNPTATISVILVGLLSSILGWVVPKSWLAKFPAIIWSVVFGASGLLYAFLLASYA